MMGRGESAKEGMEASREAEEGRRGGDERDGRHGWVVKEGGDRGARGDGGGCCKGTTDTIDHSVNPS